MNLALPADYTQMEGSIFPKLFSFIVIRREFFGGFLFNPFLFNEVSLNEMEFRILEYCNGVFSLKEISEKISEEFTLSQKTARSRMYSAFKTFDNYYAINWIQQKRASVNSLTNPVSFSSIAETTRSKEFTSKQLSAPLSVLWEITHGCNLKCKHCLSDAGMPRHDELSLEEIKQIINQLAEMKVFKIIFGGGEPFVRPDIFEILDYASKFNFGIKLTTNGTLVNNDLITRLKNTKLFTVQVSVDGLEQSHNAFRGNPESFNAAITALKTFSKVGYYTIMSTTVTRRNIYEIIELLELAVKWGVACFKASPFIPIGRGEKNVEELAIPLLDIKDLSKSLVRKRKELQKKIDIQIDGLFPWLVHLEPTEKLKNLPENVHQVGCSAGISRAVITPIGEVLACVFLRDSTAGDLRKSSLKELWMNSKIFDFFRNLKNHNLKGQCKDCEYIPRPCLGGCRASALAWTGNLLGHDPYCWKALL